VTCARSNDPLNVTLSVTEPTKVISMVMPPVTEKSNLDPIVFNDSILAKQGKKACPICCKLVHKTSIARHIREVHFNEKKNREVSNPEKEKICEICLKTFHISAIARHISVKHGNNPKIPCGICSVTFSSMIDLNQHWKDNHILEEVYKNYDCKVCSKKFQKKTYLLKHEAICETKNGPPKLAENETIPTTKVCPFCCKIFAYKDFPNHIRNDHKSKQIPKRAKNKDCPYCDIKLFRNKSIEMHIWRAHGGEGLGGPGLKSLGLKTSGLLKSTNKLIPDLLPAEPTVPVVKNDTK